MNQYEEVYKFGYEAGFAAGFTAGFDKCLKARQLKWIPVSERLPELPMCSAMVIDDMLTYYMSDTVLVYLKDGVITLGHYEYEETNNKGGWDIDGILTDYVIAWQPLPEPYEE